MDNKIVIKLTNIGAETGDHVQSSEIDEKFFARYDNEDFTDCKFNVKTTIRKLEDNILLTVDIEGGLTLPCDRCCTPLYLPVDISEDYLIKEDDDFEEEDEDSSVIYVNHRAKELDLSDVVYDMIFLSIPMKNIHPDDENGNTTCDASQLEILEKYKKKDLVDPRWEGLKNIKFN